MHKSSSFLERHFSSLSVLRRESESSDELRGPYGLTLLHAPFEPLIDFIFVHGLRGGSRKTWSRSGAIGHFWPQQWLPAEPRFKNVRIHSFGYNSDWGGRRGSDLTIHDFGQALLGDIYNSPYLCSSGTETPIVLVGHSMGGIVIKKAFLLARQDPSYRSLVNRFHSMFFLATPHRGADSAQLLDNLLRLSGFYGPKAYVGDLFPGSGAIQVINDEFRNAYAGIQLWSFFETVKTSLGLIVEKDSAILGLPGERVQLLNADHRNVCKFENPLDNNYCTIRNAFVSTIDSIEKTWLSTRKEQHRAQMRLLSQYLGVLDRPEADLIAVLEKKVEGSCEWLTNSKTFQAWREGSITTPKYFWLSGRPATGKSTIAGHVTRYLEDCNASCMYFFFKDGDATKSTISEMLRSLAWQMAWGNTEIRQVLLHMEQERDTIDRADARLIWRTIFVSRICRIELRQPCYWILDALDECSSHNALFPLLAKIEQQFPLRVFITSRPSLTIERLILQERIPMLTELINRQSSWDDIQLFLEANSRYLPVEEETERQELVQQILEKSNGNFLWVSLVLKELETIYSQQQIYDVLKSVPEEMDGLYSRILQNLATIPRNKELAKVVLKWTVCAARPLNVDELKEAVRLDTNETIPRLEKTVGSLCGHLVYVDSQSKVQVAHQTVRAFLLQTNVLSEFSLERQKVHTRLSEVCLRFLCSEEMRTSRYRRGSTHSRPSRRPVFADYATVHFADHLVRSTSSSDAQLMTLNSFFQTNSLTWIELVASRKDLSPLTQTAASLRLYLERRAKYCSPLGQEVQNISAWSGDLIQLVAKFGKALLTSPFAIHFLVPPVCPPESIIAKTFGEYPRALQMAGPSQRKWDDQLCCIGSSDVQALSIACRDNRFAIGLSSGIVRVYHATTFQEELSLTHGEPVRCLEFGSINTSLATAGRRKVNLWDSASGILLRTLVIQDHLLALDFSLDDSLLMGATRANTLKFWRIADGVEVDTGSFCDVEEEDGQGSSYLRPPTHAAFSTELKLLAVGYRQRPISLWDLEDRTFVGQFHKSAAIYPGPLIFALTFNLNSGLCLAAAAYDDGDLVTFDPWTQKQQASVNADAATLASSPDGTVLATANGVGVITLYEFETLNLLYRINSFEQSIRSMVFNANNLRFFDIRGGYCNVWEPPILARRTDAGDSSGIDISEKMPSDPHFGNTRAYDNDHVITVIAAHHEGEILFCGREDGSVATYLTASGEMSQELFSHAKSIAVLLIEWIPSRNLLVSVDRSGRLTVRKISGPSSRMVAIGALIFDRKMQSVVLQLLISPDGTRLLVSMQQADQLWDIDSGKSVFTRSVSAARTAWKWVTSPSDPDDLLLFHGNHILMFRWNSLEELSQSDCINLGFDTSICQIISSARVKCLCISSENSRVNNPLPRLRLLLKRSLQRESTRMEPGLDYDDLAENLKAVVGYYKSTLVFLSHEGWICSLNLDTLSKRQDCYSKHFFVPSRYHILDGSLGMLVTAKGSVIFPHGDELVVFHNGLEFNEHVLFERRLESPRPSMKMASRSASSGAIKIMRG